MTPDPLLDQISVPIYNQNLKSNLHVCMEYIIRNGVCNVNGTHCTNCKLCGASTIR